MISHLLDTSVYSQRLKKRPNKRVVRRWASIGDNHLAISTICEAELLFGLEKKGSERLWCEYEEFLKNKLVVLPLDRKAIETYAKLKTGLSSEGLSVADMDLLIGATALANNLRLATLNYRHFEKIPNLQVEDWS
ncbi:MAG: type II toxin-antitoxin system VapC family toxin [Opitutales bacterium]